MYIKQSVVLLFLTFHLMTSGQSKEHAGNYEFISNSDSHTIEYHLTLNPNGTFLFKYYKKAENEIPKEKIQYGKGTWTSNKRLMFFNVENADIDATYELNLNNTKARYDTKSPRDKSNRDIKTAIRIYESDIFWLKGRTLLKNVAVAMKEDAPKCCKTVKEVEAYLNGKWKSKNTDKNAVHYTFNNGHGTSNLFKKNEAGELGTLNEKASDIRILKSENGFQIEYNYKLNLGVIYDIKHLDSTKLITVRRDGKESELVRVKD